MSQTIFLDTGPLGILTNPKRPAETVAILTWAVSMLNAGHRLIVPAVADYEVRRELLRAGKTKGIAALDAWNAATKDRYLPITDSALKHAAMLWATARQSGQTTSDPKALDGDVILCAQVLDMGLPATDYVVATGNVSHLSLFVPADEWTNILP
jgi:predicted nucleic acid-binding protein